MMMALFLYHFGKKPVITNEKRKGAYVHINVMKKQEEKQSVKPPACHSFQVTDCHKT